MGEIQQACLYDNGVLVGGPAVLWSHASAQPAPAALVSQGRVRRHRLWSLYCFGPALLAWVWSELKGERNG